MAQINTTETQINYKAEELTAKLWAIVSLNRLVKMIQRKFRRTRKRTGRITRKRIDRITEKPEKPKILSSFNSDYSRSHRAFFEFNNRR